MVVFSIERLIAVYYPLTVNIIFTPTKKKCSVICALVISLAIYSFNLVTTGSETSVYSINECVPIDDWMRFNTYMTLADTVTTIFIPFIAISLINTIIVCKLTRGSTRGFLRILSHSETVTTSAKQSESVIKKSLQMSTSVKFRQSTTHDAHNNMENISVSINRHGKQTTHFSEFKRKSNKLGDSIKKVKRQEKS